MVDATVDNDPVSIVLDSSESTTVPANETWRVSIHMMNADESQMAIDGVEKFRADRDLESTQGTYLDVTLTGGQTVAELKGKSASGIFITGFVVSS